jgi:hypothetical protein
LRQWDGHRLVVIPTAIIGAVDTEGKALSGTAVRLWIALASFANSQHECFPSNRRLEEMMPEGTSRRTIQRAKQELIAAGLVTVTPRITETGRQTSDLYCLHAPSWEGDNLVVEGDKTVTHEGGSDVTHEGGQIVALESGQSVAPLTIKKELNQKEVIDRIFFTWCRAADKNPKRTKLDSKRNRLIVNALKDYSEEDVMLAVVGWRNSPWHCGKNNNGKIYNDIGLLLRDASKIETFRDLALAGAPNEKAASWDTINEILEERL